MAAIPPAALFLSFELLMTQVKGLVKRLNTVHTLQTVQLTVQKERSNLDRFVQEKQHVREKLEKEILKLERKRTMLVEDIEQRQNEKSTNSAFNTAQLETARQAKLSHKQDTMKQLVDYLNVHPNATFAEMAVAIRRSKSTVSNYVQELQTFGQLSKNGNGWVVN